MRLITRLRAAMATAALVLALPASAAFYVGDTTGAPTYQRALADFSGLSAVGTDVAYDVFSFSVTESAEYRIRSFAEGVFAGDPWDQFLFLYAGSFDPSAPLLGGLAASDDLGAIGRSGFDVALSTGVAYFLVTTGFGNDDMGRFLNVIRGPGDIIDAVPEPGTYLLLALGLVGVAFLVRRRTRDDEAND